MAAAVCVSRMGRKPVRVLLVEDDEDVREFTSEVLTADGYHVTAACNAIEAQQLDASAFDLVITDIVMPGTDGLALVRALRRTHPTLKVLFTTGYSRHIAPEALAVGEILDKPFQRDALLHAVKRLSGLQIA